MFVWASAVADHTDLFCALVVLPQSCHSSAVWVVRSLLGPCLKGRSVGLFSLLLPDSIGVFAPSGSVFFSLLFLRFFLATCCLFLSLILYVVSWSSVAAGPPQGM